MKLIKALIVATACAVCAPVASAQFSIGPRVGLQVNRFSFNKDVFDIDNQAGFTGGIQAEFMLPALNFGFDVSVMYCHRSADFKATGPAAAAESDMTTVSNDYIEIPLNFKYKIGLPVVGKIVSPYIFTGPSVAFLTSKQAINEAYRNKRVDTAWNFGFGVQLFSHLQVGASYALGMNNVFEKTSDIGGVEIEGKNNYWTVTAAWLF